MNISIMNMFGAESSKHTAVSIGAFDGLHLGHQHILSTAVKYAAENTLIPVAVMFDPLPSQFFGRIGMDQRILLQQEQEALMHSLGIERTIVIPFTQEVADLSPEAFLTSMQSKLHCDRIFMGEDFKLGKGRSGSAEVLKLLGETLGFSTEIIEKIWMDGEAISSTRIRSLLSSGKVLEANRLLGYPFFFSGSIIHGAARGRKLGFPTLNTQIPKEKIHLPNGVYAVNCIIDGEKFASVTNIGVRPTFGLEDFGIVVESFLLNAAGNYYGKTAKLEFIQMIRPEIRFNSPDDLKSQIFRDIETAKSILL